MDGENYRHFVISDTEAKGNNGKSGCLMWRQRPSRLIIGKLGGLGWELVNMQFSSGGSNYSSHNIGKRDFNATFKRRKIPETQTPETMFTLSPDYKEGIYKKSDISFGITFNEEMDKDFS